MRSPRSDEEFYAAVGLAVFQWRRVEAALRDLFTRLVLCALTGRGTGTFEVEGCFLLGSVFDSASNFSRKLNLLGQAIDRLVEEDGLKTEWQSIAIRSLALYSQRNILARGEAWHRENSEIVQFIRYSTFPDSEEELDFEQIVFATPTFYEFAERITRFAVAVNAHLAKRQAPGGIGGNPERRPDLAAVHPPRPTR